MNFEDFKNIISEQRMNRYLLSVNRDTRKAQTLYRKKSKTFPRNIYYYFML